MKKLLAITLVLAMIFAMSATVFAAEEGKTDVTIADGRTYTGYKLLNATVSEKGGEHQHGDDEPHNADCYNYAYTVNKTYRDILKAVTQKDNDEDIIAHLDGLQNDASAMRTLADALYIAIRAEDGTTVENGDEIDQGYWLLVDTTEAENNAVKSPVIVNTAGLLDLEINPKIGLPAVTKEVLEVDDATGASNWQDTATYDIGDTVTFRLTATMPNFLADWANYTVVFHDTLSAGLTLGENPTFTVTVDGQAVANPFTYAAGENGAFTLTCANVKDIAGITAGSNIVVTYTATLNANAVIAGAGNPNTVYLEYSSDPYDDATAETEDAVVTVYTYQLTVNKTDGTNPLAGATFKLEKLVKDGDTTKYVELADPTKAQNGTQFVWAGLDAGTYLLTETEAPAGYNLAEPVEITITNDNVIKDVENKTGAILPETGAQGTFMLITGGALLVVLATVFMVTRKKMSVYED